MPCEECRELSTHEFRSTGDLVNALRVAAEEMDRGVLRRIEDRGEGAPELAALRSALASGALPAAVQYSFRCEVCGDRFTLSADLAKGAGRWTREAAR